MSYTIKRPQYFDLEQIFNCGQCFRFNRHPVKTDTFCGVAFGKYIEISQTEKNVIFSCDEQEFKSVWHSFFDLDNDYSLYINRFSDDEILSQATKLSSGIRILRQDTWETLCSFIISQNNNIPRIKGIIENISKVYGEKIACFDNSQKYAFPTAEALFSAGEQKIFELKTGFRAKYIFDAADKVANGKINLDAVCDMPLEKALETLMQIRGVGPKVASCVLLFGYSKYDAFPIDVWVKRILEKYYDGTPTQHLSGRYAGIAQQYLFYYERCKNNIFL